jgi:iron transport multicopper oxidase
MLENDFLHWTNPTGAEPVPESACIYIAKDDKYLQTNEEISSGVGVNDNAFIPFEAGKTYRLRIINMAALAMFQIAIDQHDMYIIETDGVEVEPYLIDALTISAAQRYSVLVKAKNETNQNYAMMFMQSQDMYDMVPEELILNNTVQIRYADNNANATEVIYEIIPMINDTEYIPVNKEPSVTPDVEFTLHAFFDTFDDGTNRAAFSMDGSYQNVTFSPPKTPTIFTAMSMGDAASDPAIYGAQSNVLSYKHNQMVQLTVFNWDAGFHPFHLHGHHFQVIEKSFDVTSDDRVINPEMIDVQENPARRDTITIPPSGKVVLRWRADNPGAWFFHCHIDWHLSSGLAAIFVEAPEMMQERLKIPDFMIDQCETLKVPHSGNVVGKNSTTDFAGQPWGPFPLKLGWTPKAIGAMCGCIITFLVGLATIIWYGHGDLSEDELEEEVRRDIEIKQNKVPIWKKAFGGSK